MSPLSVNYLMALYSSEYYQLEQRNNLGIEYGNNCLLLQKLHLIWARQNVCPIIHTLYLADTRYSSCHFAGQSHFPKVITSAKGSFLVRLHVPARCHQIWLYHPEYLAGITTGKMEITGEHQSVKGWDKIKLYSYLTSHLVCVNESDLFTLERECKKCEEQQVE